MTDLLRMKRAYHLAEFGMLFLRTSWLHCICICNISQIKIASSRACTEEQLYRYLLKLPPLQHMQSTSLVDIDHDPMATCWCSYKVIEGDPNLVTRFRSHPLF